MKLVCFLFGHRWGRRIESGNLVYQKGDKRPSCEIFLGAMVQCKRCGEEQFIGDLRPVARIGPEELKDLKKRKGVARFDRVPKLHA